MSVHYLELMSPQRVPIRFVVAPDGEYERWIPTLSTARPLVMALDAGREVGPQTGGVTMVDAQGKHWVLRHPSVSADGELLDTPARAAGKS